MSDAKDTKAMIEELRRQGFKVSRPGAYVRRTFIVQEETLKAFTKCVQKRKVKIQDAVTEAFDAWIEANSKD